MAKHPAALRHYFDMWNERDLDSIRGHLDIAVSEDFDFCDPVHHHRGRDALEANVRQLRTERPDASFSILTKLDHHHNRYRYRWEMKDGEAIVMKGLDVTTINDVGLIERIDGFFGPLRPAPEV